jgi:hypothetical protein
VLARRGCILKATLYLSLLLVGVVSRAEEPTPEVEVTCSRSAGADWSLEIDRRQRQLLVVLGDGDEVALEIDYDGPADDGRLLGITPILGGHRLEGAFWGSTAPLIYPQLDPEEHWVERLEVHAEADLLRVRFGGGTYQILDSTGPEEPLFTEAIFRRLGERLVVNLYGLYYLLASQAGTRLDVTVAGEKVTRFIQPGDEAGTSLVLDGSAILGTVKDEASRHLEYFDRVSRVEIDDCSCRSIGNQT